MKPLIVANWKMNPSNLKDLKKLFNPIKRGIKNEKKSEVVISAPFIYLPILKALGPGKIRIGAQDVFWEEKGAYTGEISPKMLKELGVEYVIIGHSERRRNLGETDEMINKKLQAALKEGLKPILCIDNIPQVKKDLKGIAKKELRNLILAYEPIFAIGTGKPCSVDKAKKMKNLIQKNLKRNIPVLYGGSVNSQNAKDYIREGDFQGLLIGGASLKPKEFIGIIKNVR